MQHHGKSPQDHAKDYDWNYQDHLKHWRSWGSWFSWGSYGLHWLKAHNNLKGIKKKAASK